MNLQLVEFNLLRIQNLTELKRIIDSEALLGQTGTHPAFGTVTAGELIATWPKDMLLMWDPGKNI